MLPKSDKTCIFTKIYICPKNQIHFADWQAKFHEAVVTAPGFVSLEISSPEDLHPHEWGIVERFSNTNQLLEWRSSTNRADLFSELQKLLKISHVDVITKIPFEENDRHGGVTEVFVTEVAPENELTYQKWMSKIHQIEAKFPGFRGVYVQSPRKKNGKNWITLLQFDTSENLDRWLSSQERQEVMEESKAMIAALESHRMISPYAGWFSTISNNVSAPAIWKQGMIVLLVLFPIVMLEMKYLSPLTIHLNPSIAMFIGNAISVGLVTWPAVPLAIKLLDWWLSPKPDKQLWINTWGTLFVISLYIIEIMIFWIIFK